MSVEPSYSNRQVVEGGTDLYYYHGGESIKKLPGYVHIANKFEQIPGYSGGGREIAEKSVPKKTDYEFFWHRFFHYRI